ncbi:MAG: apolipoprotein N-acyltransferase [Spirochaetaceae bacterium]|nr:MAG: apolipoprotein N-acyltransferase [Spirochaetaceae bacterium]
MHRLAIVTVLFSAVLFSLALPNELFLLGNPILGLIALIPLYLVLADAKSGRDAARLGAVFGATSTLLSNYWLMFFEDYSVWTIGGTTIGYTAYNYLLGGFLWFALTQRRELRPVAFALTWTLYEYLKSVGFLGYPWGLAAYPLNSLLPAIQLVDVTGVWGLTFIVVLINASVADLVHRSHATIRSRESGSPRLRTVAFAVILAVAALFYGYVRLNADIPVRARVSTILVQQNADSWSTRDVAGPLLIAQNATTAALQRASDPVDLIVWSETALRYLFVDSRGWYATNPPAQPFLEFLETLPAPLLTGAPFLDGATGNYHNAALLIAPDSRVLGWYGKRQLVPFAESIPFWDVPAVRSLFERVVGIGGIWSPGPRHTVFPVETANGTVVIGTPICFEDAFARVTARFVLEGADLIVNLTNNSWSRTNSAQIQHFVAARFRSIEVRRTLIRSTNSGYTVHIDPWGRVVESIPMFETGSLAITVPVYAPDRHTVYLAYGDYLPFAALALLIVLALAHPSRVLIPRRRSPRRE